MRNVSASQGNAASVWDLAIYLPDLSGGGAERLHINLAHYFSRQGFSVRFLLNKNSGQLLSDVPAGCQVHVLGAGGQLSGLVKLVKYLGKNKGICVISNTEHMNITAILAAMLSRSRTKIIVTQHNAFSKQIARPGFKYSVPFLYRTLLRFADSIIAVSNGVADELARYTKIDRRKITTIYNGIVGPDFDERAKGQPVHPWLEDDADTRVILAMGRLVDQKDFATLIDAFSLVKNQEARLIILGEGPNKAQILDQIQKRGIADRVDLLGFVPNPLPWLRHARLFVLSSQFEGFGNVIVEALACGTPVVSTDCPYGPAEILEDGRYGALVDVGDAPAMARAIEAALTMDHDRDALEQRGRSFAIEACSLAYKDLILGKAPAPESAG